MSYDQKYYFLSTLYIGDLPQWVRNPFMTKEAVINWVKEMDPKQYGRIEIFDEETGNLETEQVPTIMPNMEKVNPKQQSDIDLEYPQN